ncbi:hypothetical protein D3C71_1511780 [compost metagenome]
MARGVIAGVADQVLQVAEEILHIGRQGIGFARQQVIDLRDFLEVGVLCPGLALCSTQLIGDELVVLAVNAGHGDPVANEATHGTHTAVLRQDRSLSVIARHVVVRDVVTDGAERHLSRIQPAHRGID